MTNEKPREIITRVLPATKTLGVRIAARDTQTGGKIEIPWPAGLEGREAHQKVAMHLLEALSGTHFRLGFDRETETQVVFVAWENV